MRLVPFLLVGIAIVSVTPLARSQSNGDRTTSVAFEVASVKRNPAGPNSPTRAGLQPGERVTMVNVPLLTLIQVAYPEMSAVTGGPAWIGKMNDPNFDAHRFDVAAKAPAPTTVEQLRLMLRSLLADRFKLALRTETRTVDAYALRVASADGKLGPNIRPAAADCQTLASAAAANQRPGVHPCGTIGTNIPPWRVRGVTLTQLMLFRIELGRPIVDRTGLVGPFDFELTWTPRWAQTGSFDRDRFPDIDPAGPDIFTALQEQLGLKLVAEKTDQVALFIDHAERPTEN
jgi:uncharacterized protein (TIGR03435 family)